MTHPSRAGGAPARFRAVRLAALLAAAPAAAGCGTLAVAIPSPESLAPVASDTGGLRAGFASVDITPPPGPAMIGWGPEGKRAQGYRGRLYARALVLQDRRGERVALVGLDLAMGSVLLHRQVFDTLLADSSGRDSVLARIGADRLLLTATHTHSGPGHYHGVVGLDIFGGSLGAYDSVLTRFLAQRIRRAVVDASHDLRPARAAWAVFPVWGYTRIRSFPAFQSNPPRPDSSPFRAPSHLPDPQKAVDPAWRMLRIDVWDPAAARFRPRGAFSVFAMHATGIPNANDLFDGDIHAIVSREVERHIDSLSHVPRGTRRTAVHVFANGAQGDVSPNYDPGTRCGLPKLTHGRRHTGPRTPPQADLWVEVSEAERARCMGLAKWWTDSLARGLAAEAIRRFDGLGASMDRMDEEDRSGPRLRTRDLPVARAFAALPIRQPGEFRNVCSSPRVGTSFVGGAEDGRSRVLGWKLFGFVEPGFGTVNDATYQGASRCHAQKRIALWRFQPLVVGDHGLPAVAQLSVVRVGGMLLGTVPGEPTTTVGARMRRAMGDASGFAADSVAVLAVTNGYLQYITTPEEYRWQFYEGAATEYGPRSAYFLQDQLARLAATLQPSAVGAPPGSVAPLNVYAGNPKRTYRDENDGPDPKRLTRAFTRQRWEDGALVVRWHDLYPGRLVPADTPVLAIYREDPPHQPELVTWDDDHRVEVRALGPRGRRGYEWEARWTPCRHPPGSYRVVLLARPGLPPVEGAAIRIDAPPWCLRPHPSGAGGS